MKSRLAVFVVVAAAAVLLLGGVCGRKLYPPEFVSVPNSVYAGDTAWVRLATSGRGYDSVRYVVNWDDVTDTTPPLGLLDTATVWHIYAAAPDTKYVGAAVYAPDDPQGIRWAAHQPVVVVEAGGSHAPVIDTAALAQVIGVRGAPTFFIVKAHDPNGDSVRLEFDWGATETTTAYFASPCSVTVGHVFTQAETAVVITSAQDIRGATSLPDTVFVPVGTAGGVKWYWPDSEGGGFSTSPLVYEDGEDERVCGSSYGDSRFYSLSVSGRGVKRTEYALAGQAAFCEATQHIIVGGDGRLHALKLSLQQAWDWSDGDSVHLAWGAPAIRDDRICIPREDGSLWCFIDSFDHGVRVATFAANAGVVDAPVIDAQGNVYFGTDSGYLYKVGPELNTLFWRTRLIANGEIHSPIVGSDGTAYCASDSSRVYAIDPETGAPLWVVATDGEPLRLAAGHTAIFVGTSLGVMYSISPTTGTINWQKSLAPGYSFNTSPIVAAGGIVYVQDDNDVLYCLDQVDGTTIWSCDCNSYLPGGGRSGSPRPRRAGLTDYDPNPTILFNGNIIVAGYDVLYCVAGYPRWFSEPRAPWPKWQCDLHNAGYVGGGK
jgi:outer membrane protein assembly factor BamB